MRGASHRLHVCGVLLPCAAAACCSKAPDASDTPHIGKASRGAALLVRLRRLSFVPGVSGADAMVGPPLDHFARRGYVAGMLPNTPDNLMRWIRDPQKIVPGNAMPALGIDEHDARDIAAYLYTLQ